MKTLTFALLLVFVVAAGASADVHKAVRFFREGNWKRAIEELRGNAAHMRDVEALNMLGEAYFYSGDAEAAEEAFAEAMDIEDNPGSAISLAMLRAVRRKGNIKDLQLLSDKYGESARFHRSLGVAYMKNQEYEKAIASFSKALELDPGDFMSYFHMGESYEEGHFLDMAIDAYRKALALNPSFAYALNNLGYCYKEKRYYTYAIEMYGKAISIKPDEPGFYYNLGNAFSHKNKVYEALAAYTRAVDLEPAFAQAHYNLGRTYVKMDRFEDAIESFRLYIRHWDKSLDSVPAPRPREVREEIEMLQDMLNGDGDENGKI